MFESGALEQLMAFPIRDDVMSPRFAVTDQCATALLLRTAPCCSAPRRAARATTTSGCGSPLGDGAPAPARGACREAMMCARCDESAHARLPGDERRAEAARAARRVLDRPRAHRARAAVRAREPHGRDAAARARPRWKRTSRRCTAARRPPAPRARARPPSWDRVELVWERRLPRELRAACARAWPCDPVGFGSRLPTAHSAPAARLRLRDRCVGDVRARALGNGSYSSRERRVFPRARARARATRARAPAATCCRSAGCGSTPATRSRGPRAASRTSRDEAEAGLSLSRVARPAPAWPAALLAQRPPWASAADARAGRSARRPVRLAAARAARARRPCIARRAAGTGVHGCLARRPARPRARARGAVDVLGRGRVVWAKLGRTIVGARPRQVWLRLHGVERCEDAPRGAGSCEDVVRKRDVFPEARRQGFDTVVYAFLLRGAAGARGSGMALRPLFSQVRVPRRGDDARAARRDHPPRLRRERGRLGRRARVGLARGGRRVRARRALHARAGVTDAAGARGRSP